MRFRGRVVRACARHRRWPQGFIGDGTVDARTAPRSGLRMGWDGAGMRCRGPVVRACARHHRLTLRHLPHGATPLRGRRPPDRTGPPGSLAGAVWDTGGMNESSDRLAERYGKPIISPRAGKVIAIVARLLLLAIVSFMGLNYADRPVSSDVLTYEHVASDRIAVEFTVSMDPGTEAV